MAAALAVSSPRVRTDIIEASEFPALAQRYNVYAVPKIVINDAYEFVGALPEPHFVDVVARAVKGEFAPAGESGEDVPGEATLLEPAGENLLDEPGEG